MFSIGEFARLGGVSVRALRHYDELGLSLIQARRLMDGVTLDELRGTIELTDH
jgi:MerR family regulatory protein